MGCKSSKQSREEPQAPSFRVLNVPAFVPSTETLSTVPNPAGTTNLTASAYLNNAYPAELPSDSTPARPQIAPDGDYHLHAQMAALPGVPPLQQRQYLPYRPSAPVQTHSHQHPDPSPPQSPQHPPPSPKALTPISTPIRQPRPGFIRIPPSPPFTPITYPPIPYVPEGMTLSEVLKPKGKRRWQSLREAGREMSVVDRHRGTGDGRLSREQRRGSNGSLAEIRSLRSEKRERKREKMLGRRGGARRFWLD
ncbi:MAG: hypothetical protein Q9188_005997 [Gyalolechia gomerana]